MYEGLKNLEVPSGGGRHPRARKALKVSLAGLAIFSVLLVGFGAAVYIRVKSNLERGVDEQLRGLAAGLPDDPINILVLGSDSRKGVTKADKKKGLGGPAGQRSDVIMLLHIAEKGKKAVLVSFPRDLRVEIPGHGINKMNAAYSYGGPNLVIKTIKRFTGLKINHFVEVNFLSFRGIVNAVGGVAVHTDRALDDTNAQLHIPGPGCWVLGGDQALAYVRARYVDPTADIGRIQRQQGFLRALAARVRSAGVLLRPDRVLRLSGEIGKGMRYDKGLKDINLAKAIAARLAGFDKRKLDFRIVPNYPQYIGGISYLIPKTDEANALFAAIKADRAVPAVGLTDESVPKRGDVTVQILNGTKKAGLASKETTRLQKKGFSLTTPGNAHRRARTLIRYETDADLKVDLVRKFYPHAVVRRVTSSLGADVVVTLGKDVLSPNATPEPEDPATQTPTEQCRKL